MTLARSPKAEDRGIAAKRMGKKKGPLLVMEACSAEEALEILIKRRTEFDAVLVDLMMPKVDGYSFCRMTRCVEEDGGLTPILMIAVTAACVPDVEDQCVEAGFDWMFEKPFTRAVCAKVADLARTVVKTW